MILFNKVSLHVVMELHRVQTPNGFGGKWYNAREEKLCSQTFRLPRNEENESGHRSRSRSLVLIDTRCALNHLSGRINVHSSIAFLNVTLKTKIFTWTCDCREHFPTFLWGLYLTNTIGIIQYVHFCTKDKITEQT